MKHFFLFIVLFFLFSFTNIFAQYSVKVGQENSGDINFNLCNNQYEYSWNATVYTQQDIQSHGLITDIYYESELFGGFGPGSNTFMQHQRIFMKAVSNNEMTSTAFPDTNQMTLVYSGMVEFLNYQLATIHLDVPFNLDADKNLMILYINENGTAQTDQNYFLFYPTQNYYTHNNTVYNHGNGSFPSGAGTYSDNMPVVYLRYAPGLDVGISSINNNEAFKLPQQTDLTCNLHNYMADTITSATIEYKLNGTSQPTINWTGNSYCGQDVSVVLQNNFAFTPGQYTIKANTSNPNSGADELNTNDTLEFTLNVSDNKNIAFQNYSNNAIPFLSGASYGWSVAIYNKDSINFSGQIRAIAYYVTNSNGNTTPEPHQKIFMRTTSDYTNPNTDYPDTNLFVKVFDGTIDYTSAGWHIIELDTVFDYNSTENLMILYENHAGFSVTPSTSFKVGWVGTDAVYNYDINTFPTGSGWIAYSNRVPALKLFFSIPKDAGITKLANSEAPVYTGNYDFIVDLKNYGLDTLQDVDIKYSIDQNTPNSYHWNGIANPLNEITDINVGTSNLTYGTHNIKIWTENPNYLPDYTNGNDTLTVSLRACSPLSGTYTIGTAPSDFVSIKAAIDTLNNCGVNGAVTFNIKPGTYNSQYILNKVWGASATNTITFQSQTGDSTDVVLTTDSTNYLMFLNNAHYISFKYLTFKSDSAEKLVVLDTNACNNTFVGNIFTSDTTISTFIFSQTNNTDNHILITGNLFENGNTGIDLYQDNVYYNSNLLIENNVFIGQSQKAIQLYNLNEGNIVNNQFIATNIGIYLHGTNHISINANNLRLQNANKGIFVDNCLETTISNNFISGNTISSCGIYTKQSNIVKLFYNTVDLDNAETSVFIDYGNDSVFVYNNIFINHTGQAIKKFSSNYLGNNNCFYTPGTIFGSWEGYNNVNNFQQWQTMSQNDTNSIFALPYFISATDLHTQSLLIDNLGIPLSEITTDIDGEIRDTLTPDIGADEFTSSCNGPLAGNYTIGNSGDYPSFTDAVEALYYCGVADTVNFEIEPGTYNEQVAIDGSNINYTNGVKPITFTSQTSNPDDVVLKYSADTMNNFTVKIKDISQLIIDGITMQALDTTYGRVLTFENVVDSINIINNKIIGIDSASVNNQTTCAYLDNLNEDSVMYLNFTGNSFINGKIAIGVIDFWNIFNNLIINIDNNSFLSQTDKVIYLKSKIASINHNYINSNFAEDAIYINSSNSLFISKNKIILSSHSPYGHGITTWGTTKIYNNFISINGLGIGCHNKTNIFNNTVLLTDANYAYPCIEPDGTDTIRIFNNCLININGGEVIHNYNNNYSNLVADYNNLYSTSLNFNDLVNTLGGNTHSVSFMPDFVSNTDLHTNAALLYQTGVSLPEITEDIDGETRNNPPCIGADEFSNPVFHAGNDTVFCYNTGGFYDTYNTYIYDIGTGYDSYQWSNGSDSSSISIDTLNSVIGNNQYTVTVTVGANTYSDTVNILYDLPTAISQTDYCINIGDSIELWAEPNLTYLWNGTDTTQNYMLYPYTPPTLEVTDSHGCKNYVSINNEITLEPAHIYIDDLNDYTGPFVSAPTDTSICSNAIIGLIANNYFGNTGIYDDYSYLWNTGDTTHSIVVDSAHYGIGVHEFSVIVTNKNTEMQCESYDTVFVEIKNCNGINEPSSENNVTLFPNPVKDVLYLNFYQQATNINYLQIIDFTGQTIINKKIQNKDKPIIIDTKSLKNGIYFIKVIYGDNSYFLKKFIIQK